MAAVLQNIINDTDITLLINKIRTDKGLSKKRLSIMSGVSRSSITEIETTNRMPSILTMLRIAAALQCKIDDLVCIKAQEVLYD